MSLWNLIPPSTSLRRRHTLEGDRSPVFLFLSRQPTSSRFTGLELLPTLRESASLPSSPSCSELTVVRRVFLLPSFFVDIHVPSKYKFGSDQPLLPVGVFYFGGTLQYGERAILSQRKQPKSRADGLVVLLFDSRSQGRRADSTTRSSSTWPSSTEKFECSSGTELE